MTTINTHPLWLDQELPPFPSLQKDLEADVVVVGGGITGITTAYLLTQAGVKVALIERERLASVDTARTTAHLTYVTDLRLHELVKQLGQDGARAFWHAGATAIDHIESIVTSTGVACDFQRVPGYLHQSRDSTDKQEIDRLKQDAQLARELGFDAGYVDATPHVMRPGVQFADQARFHPRKYLQGLLKDIVGRGGHVFEQSAFDEVEEQPFAVRANGKRIRCDYLVLATHNPLMGQKGMLGAALFQTKLALYTSYAIGARLPSGERLPDALFWDTADPYDYLRLLRREDRYAIFGGSDVKTGQEEDTVEVFNSLHARLRARVPDAEIQDRWMGQVIETDDGLPFIGENGSRQFIATGFSGNGMTLGTVAAMMACDRFLGRENPWTDLFRVDRTPFHGGVWQYLKENVDYPWHMVRDRLAGAQGTDTEAIAKGEGRILRLHGKKVAAYRDDKGKLTLCSAVCTHMACLVRWNQADSTWDCPCHGSRFHPDGSVLSGPAEDPMEKI